MKARSFFKRFKSWDVARQVWRELHAGHQIVATCAIELSNRTSISTMSILFLRPWLSVGESCSVHPRSGCEFPVAARFSCFGDKVAAALTVNTKRTNGDKQTQIPRNKRISLSSQTNTQQRLSCGAGKGKEMKAEDENDSSTSMQEAEFAPRLAEIGDGKFLGGDPGIGGDRECGREERKLHGRRVGRRAAVLGAGYAVLGVVNCVCCERASSAEITDSEWDYGGPSGVAKWQGLCVAGRNQSPVNIAPSKAKNGESLGELQFDYWPGTPTIVNPGHCTMQVSFTETKNILRVGDRAMELLQFHFHSPSEHAFDGKRFAMEAHLVHRDMRTKKLAVVGIMLDADKYSVPNKGLAESLSHAPAEHGRSVHIHDVTFSPGVLLPPQTRNSKRRYLHYVGSLSTPPCTEDVDWFILEKPLHIPTSQVLDFLRFAGDGRSLAFNSRPLQPLNGRVVHEGP